MSGRHPKRGKGRAHSVVVIAGEDRNDRESLKILLEEKRPGLRGSIVQIRDTVRLHRATGTNLTKRVRSIINKAEGVAEKHGPGTRAACLYVHEDFDAVDGPAYVEAHRRVEQEIHRQLGHGHYVLAVAEMEAWMLLFPEALPAVMQAWKLPVKRLGKDTGRFPDPKGILMREVSKATGRRYAESDAPAVFRAIVEGGHLEKPRGMNSSWKRFWQDVEKCGQEHFRR